MAEPHLPLFLAGLHRHAARIVLAVSDGPAAEAAWTPTDFWLCCHFVPSILFIEALRFSVAALGARPALAGSAEGRRSGFSSPDRTPHPPLRGPPSPARGEGSIPDLGTINDSSPLPPLPQGERALFLVWAQSMILLPSPLAGEGQGVRGRRMTAARVRRYSNPQYSLPDTPFRLAVTNSPHPSARRCRPGACLARRMAISAMCFTAHSK